MSEGGSAGRLIIMCGLPGSGKTTQARRLEEALGAVRLCPDEWIDALGIDLFDEPARARIEQLQWALAQRLLSRAVPVVIEWGTWNKYERDALRQAARNDGSPRRVALPRCSGRRAVGGVEERDRHLPAAQRRLTRADIAVYDRLIERPDADELALFDPPPAPPTAVR